MKSSKSSTFSLLRTTCALVALFAFAASALAQVKISQLPTTTTATGSDIVPIVHGGTTSKVTLTNLAKAFGSTLVINVKDAPYSAAGNGTTDDTAALQAALTAAGAGGTKSTVFIPRGTYKVTSTLTSTEAVILEGEGPASVIMAHGNFGDILSFNKPALAANPWIAPGEDPSLPTDVSQGFVGCIFRNLKIDSADAMTSGSAVKVAWSHATIFDEVYIGTESSGSATLYDGITLLWQSACNVNACHICTSRRGVYVAGFPMEGQMPYHGYNGVIGGETDIWGKECVQHSAAITIAGGCGGFRIEPGCNMSHYDFGTVVDDGSSITGMGANREIWLGGYNDGNVDAGILIKAGSASQVHIVDGWAAGNGIFNQGWELYKTGLRCDNAASLDIVGGQFYLNLVHDMDLTAGDVTMTGTRAPFTLLDGAAKAIIVGGEFSRIESSAGDILLTGAQVKQALIDAGTTKISILGANIPPLDPDDNSGLQIDGSITDVNILGVGGYPNRFSAPLALPNLTKAQRDALDSPVAGLEIFQSDHTPGKRVFNGTAWMRFTETAD
jgi:sulfur relay (sulfurtransferase) complex TusBCD TusD component (DsrE family)